jgi:hypothetical protein
MPRNLATIIAANAAACSQAFPSASPLQVLDTAMRGHVLTAPHLTDIAAEFESLVLTASQDEALFIPEMHQLDFLRLRYGLRPDEPARNGLEWQDRAALVLQTNCDTWPPGETRVRDRLEDWAAELRAQHGATESPERVALGIGAAGGRALLKRPPRHFGPLS